MGIIEEYWSGVLDRLQAEVDILARLVKHAGEMGREHEVALQRLLERLLPTQYGLGSGLIIDSLNQYSRQADIVVYDQHTQPRLMFQTTPLLFPVETVFACIEVKASLRTSDIEDVRKKARALRSLAISEEPTEVARPPGDHLSPTLIRLSHPYFFVLAYAAKGVSASNIIRRFAAADNDEMPDTLLILKQGLLAHKTHRPWHIHADFDGGTVFLHKRDRNRRRMLMPEPVPAHPRLPPDPARALLLFLTEVTRLIGSMHLDPYPLMDRYLHDEQGGVDLFSQVQPIPKPAE